MGISEQIDEVIGYLQISQAYYAKDNAIEAWYWSQQALRVMNEVQTSLDACASQQEKEEDERLRKQRKA